MSIVSTIYIVVTDGQVIGGERKFITKGHKRDESSIFD